MANRLLEEFLEIQFFGEFLVDRWIINREQLLEALACQIERNQRFGGIAMRKGYLTSEQVTRINDRQRATDMSFGELAVSMGFVDKDQAAEIIEYQRDNNVHLGEVLLRLGYLTEDLLKRELQNYREHQRRYVPTQVSVPEGVQARHLLEACVDMTAKIFRRVAGVTAKVGHGLVIQPSEEEDRSGYYVSALVPMQEAGLVRYVLSVSRDLAFRIAGSILKEDASGENLEMIADAFKEFCNIICGNAAAQLSRRGIQVEIAPPEAYPRFPTTPDQHVNVAFPIRLIEGGVDLRFYVPPVE